jgi:hypothetical protein
VCVNNRRSAWFSSRSIRFWRNSGPIDGRDIDSGDPSLSEQLRVVKARIGSEHPVCHALGQLIGPLRDRGGRNTNGLCGGCDAAAEQVEGVCFVHTRDVSRLTQAVKPANLVSRLNYEGHKRKTVRDVQLCRQAGIREILAD